MQNLIAFISGLLGGAGLVVSGMTNTKTIQGWLDFTGNWDPTLAFVLTGALIPMAIAWRIAKRRSTAVLGETTPVFPDKKVDPNLILGSVLFGIGWGLAGICPGPALASITFGGVGGLVFLAAMAGGVIVAPPLKLRFSVV